MTAEETAEKQKKIKKARAMWQMTLLGKNDVEEGRLAQIDSAKTIYENYLKNNNLTKEEVEISDERRFKIKYQDEFELCANVIASVNPFAKLSYEMGLIKVCLDSEDYAEAKCKFKHFKELWRADHAMLKMAFNTKHAVWFQPSEYVMKKHAKTAGTNIYEQAKKQAEEKNQKLVGEDPNKINVKQALTDEEKLFAYNLMRMQNMLPHLASADYIPTR